jgi:hypothetical protein
MQDIMHLIKIPASAERVYGAITTADRDDTTPLFAHRGFPRADGGFASATTRWGFYLLSLKRYLQTGKGTPNPDDSEGLG